MNFDISLDLYKIFCAVVRTGNMSAAGKEMFISQPAVSMAVKQLEDRMGSPLLIRTTKGVRPTPEGEVLYEYLEQALSLIKKAEHRYREMVDLESGEIRISASDTVISNFLMPYIEAYYNNYSNITIKVTNKTTYESIKLLKSGSVDMCFINLPLENEDDLEVMECVEIHDCIIAGAKYKDLAEKGIDVKDLEEYPVLMLESISNSRKYVDKYLKDNKVDVKPIMELGSNDILINFARINMGLTFNIKEFSGDIIDNKNIFEIPINPPIPKRGVGLVKLKSVGLSNAAKKFIQLLNVEFTV